YGVISGRNSNCPQYIVYLKIRFLCPIDIGVPSIGIVHFRKNAHTGIWIVGSVNKMIGLIMGEDNGSGGILLEPESVEPREILCVYHRFILNVQTVQGLDLGIGRGYGQ